MEVYVQFLFELLSQLFGGIGRVFSGLFDGVVQIFNFSKYFEIVGEYQEEIGGAQWILVAMAIIIVMAVIAALAFLVVLLIRKYARIRKSLVEQESLLEEVGKLNRQVLKLTQEKEKVFAMKVSQLGLKPGEDPNEVVDVDAEGNDIKKEETALNPEKDSRFYKLTQIDIQMENFVQPETENNFTLSELCERFRNFACSKMGLYYRIEIIRLFVAALGATRLVVLQGISGTGKTSLPYAWGKFLMNDAIIASVQPSWRDRTELFGFFNEFTKKFNETEVLKKMYEATYIDQVYLTILDEMNIARVEYYFAEMLSILEMPSRDEWIIDLVPNVWPTDPKKLVDGKLKLPDNMWYIGTINNDDSTFMVTDKVYDRAMPIDINEKGTKFEAPVTEPMKVSSKYLESLFTEAKEKYPISDDIMNKLTQMDDYVIEHFRLAFGNRIVKHLKEFVPVYVACGGTEVEAFDYVIAKKILRKFEQLNLSFIRDEIDGFVEFLNKTFGKGSMKESIEYVLRLKKMM